MIYDNTNEIIQEIFKSLHSRHQTVLEELVKGSDFIIDCVNLLHCKCHKINLKPGGPYIGCIKNKKATTSPINDDNKSFQYAATIALNHKEKGRNLQRASEVNPFKVKYNWEGLDYPSKKDDLKKFEKNNPKIGLNVLYVTKINICSQLLIYTQLESLF